MLILRTKMSKYSCDSYWSRYSRIPHRKEFTNPAEFRNYGPLWSFMYHFVHLGHLGHFGDHLPACLRGYRPTAVKLNTSAQLLSSIEPIDVVLPDVS